MPSIDEILALDRLTLEDEVGPDGEVVSDEWLRRRLEEALLTSQLCTVKRNGTLVAYAMLHPQTESRWFVTCFNTHPSYRTAPVLLELFVAFSELVSRHGIVELRSNVFRTNEQSLAFHKKLGFRVTKENAQAAELSTTIADMISTSSLARTMKRLQLPQPPKQQP